MLAFGFFCGSTACRRWACRTEGSWVQGLGFGAGSRDSGICGLLLPSFRHVLSRFSEQVVETRGNVVKQGFFYRLGCFMSLSGAARPQLLSDAKPPKPSMFPLPHEHEEVRLASFKREGGGGGAGRSAPKIVTAPVHHARRRLCQTSPGNCVGPGSRV